MSQRYARLNKNWMLRGWDNLPTALVNWANGEQRELSKIGFYVAQSCDGRTDFDSLAFLPQHRAWLDLLVAEGVAQACGQGDAIEPWQRYRKARNPRLAGIHWCVTGRCNLNCRHCHVEAPAGRYGELPFDTMAGLVEQFVRANVAQVSLSGGEPFLRTDLLEIIELLADKKIYLSRIFSNGLLITDHHLESIRTIGFRPAFQISFDGIGAHDQMRGAKGIEPGVLAAIRRLRAAGFPVTVATSIDQVNIGTLAKTYKLMKQLDVQSWNVAAPQETGNWRGTTTAASMEMQAQAFAPLLRAWIKDGRPFIIRLGGFYGGGDLQRLQATLSDEAARQIVGSGQGWPGPRKNAAGAKATTRKPLAPAFTPDSYDCGSCREQSMLLPDGTLITCPGYVDTSLQAQMPNLLREELSKVWKNSFLRKIADIRKKDVLANNPQCAACELFFTDCGGGCRASALTQTGNLMSRDPVTCDMFKKGFKKSFREMAASADAP
jgi:radical SAM protein with 4Fe4S-binding SPASM domain